MRVVVPLTGNPPITVEVGSLPATSPTGSTATSSSSSGTASSGEAPTDPAGVPTPAPTPTPAICTSRVGAATVCITSTPEPVLEDQLSGEGLLAWTAPTPPPRGHDARLNFNRP